MIKNNVPVIIGLTTDPYDSIYGYALVFFRFFNFLQKDFVGNVLLFSNDGLCSTLVNNSNFSLIKLPRRSNLFVKAFLESLYFYLKCRKQPTNSIFIVNCEIPELCVGVVLKMQRRKVFCILPDDRVRNSTFFVKVVCQVRLLLVSMIRNVLFTNRYTFNRFKGNLNAFYLGNPVF
jgi:hypothetical protein